MKHILSIMLLIFIGHVTPIFAWGIDFCNISGRREILQAYDGSYYTPYGNIYYAKWTITGGTIVGFTEPTIEVQSATLSNGNTVLEVYGDNPEDVRIYVNWDKPGIPRVYLEMKGAGLLGSCGIQTASFYPFPDGNHPGQIKQIKAPSCTDGTFKYTIPKTEGTTYNWSVPTGWTVWGNTSGDWTTTIEGTANNNNQQGYFNGGEVKCWGTYKELGTGNTKNYSITFNASGSKGVVAWFSDDEFALCYGSNADAALKVNAMGTAPFTYDWTVNQNVWSVNVTPPYNNETLLIRKQQWTDISGKQLAVKVTDANGCYGTASVTLKMNEGWKSASPYATGHQPAMSGANIVSDLLGNPYYVGNDAKIYAYDWDYQNGIWVNYAIGDVQNARPWIAYNSTSYPYNHTIAYINSADSKVYETKTLENTYYWQTKDTRKDANGNSFQAQGHLNFYNSKLYSLSMSNAIQEESTPLITLTGTLTSDAFAFANNALFYVENNVLKAIDLTTKQPITNFYPRTVMNGSNLEASDKGYIFYIATDGSLNYLFKNGNGYENRQAGINRNIDRFFSVNKKTGVVYVKANLGNTTEMFQYYEANYTYFDRRIDDNFTVSDMNGSIKFANPNVFYVSKDANKVKMVYFLTGGCTPVTFRQGNDALSPERDLVIETSTPNKTFTVYPNPATEDVNIQTSLDENTHTVSIEIYNNMGQLVLSSNEHYNISGDYTISQNVAQLATGMYVIRLVVDGTPKGTEKLIIK